MVIISSILIGFIALAFCFMIALVIYKYELEWLFALVFVSYIVGIIIQVILNV